jgi:hypothetical protein
VAGTEFRTLDMQWLAGPSLLAVVLGSRAVGTGDRHTSRSYMNPATGQASGAPAAVTITDAVGREQPAHPREPEHPGGLERHDELVFLRVEGHRQRGQRRPGALQDHHRHARGSLRRRQWSASRTPTTPRPIGACCGYVAANGDQVIYEHFDNLNVEPSPWNYVITKRVRGSVTTDTVWARGQWLASKPVLLSGTQWYVMTGYEDDGIALATSFQARGVQRTYNLRDASNGNVVGQALTENAGGLWHNTDTPLAATLGLQYPAKVPAAYLSGGKLYMAAMMAAGSLLDLSAGVIAWDFAATYGYPGSVSRPRAGARRHPHDSSATRRTCGR